MSDSRKRRPRKRVTIELEPEDEALLYRARMVAVRRKMTLRAYLLLAINLAVADDEVDRDS